MARLRIVVANEPRAYREVISSALQELRPQLDVIAIEPVQLDGAITGLTPDIVICSLLAVCDGVRRAATWISLYPKGESRAVVRMEGACTVTGDLELGDLLSVVDRTARLAQFS